MKARGAMYAANIATFLCLAGSGQCKSLVQINVQVGDQGATRGYSNVLSAVDALSTNRGLRGLVPGYTDASAVAGSANIYGVGITTSYAADSSVLTFTAPSCGVNQTFSGSTRDQSNRLLKDYVKQNSDSLTKCLAKSSPQFGGGPTFEGSRIATFAADKLLSDSTSGFGLDARFGSVAAGGYRTNDLSLPVGYTWRLSARDAVELYVPVSVADTEGGKSYGAGVGLLWRRRITTNWTLQPSVHVGAAGSVDLATVAAFWSVGLNSVANFDLPAQWRVTLANGLIYISSLPLSVGGYKLDYGISNLVFRNGVLFSRDLGFKVFNLPTRGSVFAFDNRYAGTALSVKNYQEFGFFASLGSIAPARLGATYLTGDRGLHGFTVNTGVRF